MVKEGRSRLRGPVLAFVVSSWLHRNGSPKHIKPYSYYAHVRNDYVNVYDVNDASKSKPPKLIAVVSPTQKYPHYTEIKRNYTTKGPRRMAGVFEGRQENRLFNSDGW